MVLLARTMPKNFNHCIHCGRTSFLNVVCDQCARGARSRSPAARGVVEPRVVKTEPSAEERRATRAMVEAAASQAASAREAARIQEEGFRAQRHHESVIQAFEHQRLQQEYAAQQRQAFDENLVRFFSDACHGVREACIAGEVVQAISRIAFAESHYYTLRQQCLSLRAQADLDSLRGAYIEQLDHQLNSKEGFEAASEEASDFFLALAEIEADADDTIERAAATLNEYRVNTVISRERFAAVHAETEAYAHTLRGLHEELGTLLARWHSSVDETLFALVLPIFRGAATSPLFGGFSGRFEEIRETLELQLGMPFEDFASSLSGLGGRLSDQSDEVGRVRGLLDQVVARQWFAAELNALGNWLSDAESELSALESQAQDQMAPQNSAVEDAEAYGHAMALGSYAANLANQITKEITDRDWLLSAESRSAIVATFGEVCSPEPGLISWVELLLERLDLARRRGFKVRDWAGSLTKQASRWRERVCAGTPDIAGLVRAVEGLLPEHAVEGIETEVVRRTSTLGAGVRAALSSAAAIQARHLEVRLDTLLGRLAETRMRPVALPPAPPVSVQR